LQMRYRRLKDRMWIWTDKDVSGLSLFDVAC
jgi:hypothetical protein